MERLRLFDWPLDLYYLRRTGCSRPPKNPFHGDPLKGVIMRSSEEVDRKLNQVLTEIRTIQVELKIVRRAVDEGRAADVGMASMTAEDIDLKLSKILERLA
jgi:hypothetical protein